MMKISLELNQRYGHGYQARLIMPPIDSVLDDEAYTLYEAAQGAEMALQEINEATGSGYRLHEILSITEEALQVNSTRDIASLKFLREMRAGDYTNLYPSPAQEDFTKTVIDGEEAYLMSGRGVVLTCYWSWKDDKKPKARAFLEAYCKLIAARGCTGGASRLFKRLEGMDKRDAVNWIKETYGQYVRSNEEIMGLFRSII